MKKTTVILFVIIAVSLLTGCQPTPGTPAVLGKDLEQMLALAKSGEDTEGSIRERLGVPERYESYIEDETGKLKVTIDADIILSDAYMPVTWVEAQPFGQDTVDKLISVLFGKGKLYDPDAMSVMTKSEVSDRLMQMQLKKAQLIEQGMKPLSPHATEGSEATAVPGSYEVGGTTQWNELDGTIESIATYESMLNAAPEEKKLVEVTGQLERSEVVATVPEYEGKLYEQAHAGRPNPEGGMSSLYVVNDEVYNSYIAEYVNRKDFSIDFGVYYSPDEWQERAKERDKAIANALPAPKITETEARSVSERFLKNMGLDYLVFERSEIVTGGSGIEYSGGVTEGNIIKAYCLQYVRQIGGIPVTYTNVETSGTTAEDDFIWNWPYEKMTLIIDDSGIAGMKWEAPYRLGDTVTNSATMLPFSKIKSVFEKMIVVGNLYYKEYDGEININEVRLGLARITAQNNLKDGLLIPVWDFFGTITTHYEEDGQSKQHTVSDTGLSLLTINAIDGAVIDRSKGY